MKNLSRGCGTQLTLYLKYLATRFDICRKAIELNVLILWHVECIPGYYMPADTCVPCPMDTFKTELGNDQHCEVCPSDSTTSGRRAQTNNTCGMT